MNNNKTAKYLLYAIGEILLVVVGILIALQIDNWNESRKDRALELVYYSKFLEDFELNKLQINKLVNEADSRIETGRQLIIDLHAQTKDKHYIINQWVKSQRAENFIPNRLAFDDLMSSGNLTLLSDSKLKESLINYHITLERVENEISRTNTAVANTYTFEDNAEFGIQELDYMKTLLGQEIQQLLPIYNWHLNKKSTYFTKLQSDLIITIAMNDRQKQHYAKLQKAMIEPYQMLLKYKN